MIYFTNIANHAVVLLVCGSQRRLQSEYIIHDKFNAFLSNLEIFPSSQQAPPELIYVMCAGDYPEESRHFKLQPYPDSNTSYIGLAASSLYERTSIFYGH